MKEGDLCRVNNSRSHNPSQLGEFVVLLDVLGAKYWRALNLSTGEWHHYKITDLEFISESR